MLYLVKNQSRHMCDSFLTTKINFQKFLFHPYCAPDIKLDLDFFKTFDPIVTFMITILPHLLLNAFIPFAIMVICY